VGVNGAGGKGLTRCAWRGRCEAGKSKRHLKSVGGRDSCSKQRLNCEAVAVYNSRAVNKPVLILSEAAP